MAEALFNAEAPPGWRAGSAGTEPAAHLRPEAVAVMREIGLDISAQRPKGLSQALGPEVALVIGLRAEDACPRVPGAGSEHWPLPDPAGTTDLDVYRGIRNELQQRIQDLITRLGNKDAAPSHVSLGDDDDP